jgi:hypothetical protein
VHDDGTLARRGLGDERRGDAECFVLSGRRHG